MIDPDGVHAVEQFALAKYYLTTNVYRHRVRLISDQMLVRAIELGIERDDLANLKSLYAYGQGQAADFVRNYVLWDDARFLNEFAVRGKAGRCKALLDRLRERRLLKRVLASKVVDYDEKVREALVGLSGARGRLSRTPIEQEIAGVLRGVAGQGLEGDLVILHVFDIRSVRETSRNEEGEVLVAREPTPRPFSEESTLFRSIDEANVDHFIEVYAPVVWETDSEKKRIRRDAYAPIKEVIERSCSGGHKGGNP